MISNVILAALAVAGGAEKPVPLPTVIQCTLSLARAQAQSESRTACLALEALPRSTCRDYLLQLADFAVTRTF